MDAPDDVEQSVDERRAEGRSIHTSIPRSAHGEWSPSSDRANPLEILEAQAETRLAELGRIRYERMAESPFSFFRGAAAVMAMDLAVTPTTGHARPGLRRRACQQLRLLRQP